MEQRLINSFHTPEFLRNPEFSLLIPCYCEEPFLRANVLRLVELLSVGRFQFELVFVEDESPDGTLRVLKDLVVELTHRRVSHCVIAHEKNRGRGAAVKTGIRAAKGKVAGFIDIDLENSPEAIFPMYGLIENRELDLVVGTRVQFGPDLRPMRRLTHLVYKWLVHKIVSLPVTDTETGLKLFRRDSIATLLELTENDHWFWDTEVVLVAHACGLKVGEYPVLFYRDATKQSTVRIFRDSLLYLKALLEYRRWPLKN
ncbi:MAG: glycosyltransferase family 2 protein, partial [Bdellovibrionota bacterium]